MTGAFVLAVARTAIVLTEFTVEVFRTNTMRLGAVVQLAATAIAGQRASGRLCGTQDAELIGDGNGDVRWRRRFDGVVGTFAGVTEGIGGE